MRHQQCEPGYAGIYWDKGNRKIVVTRDGYGRYRQSIDGAVPAAICPAVLEQLVETRQYTRQRDEKSAAIKYGEGFTGDPGTLFSLEWEK